MKLTTIMTALAFASHTAAWGMINYCLKGPKTIQGSLDYDHDCVMDVITNETCHNLPTGDGTKGHPNVRGNAHYVGAGLGLLCKVFTNTGCDGFVEDITDESNGHFAQTISSVSCMTNDG